MSTYDQHIVPAPAKINLGLEVGTRRDDAYHNVNTVFVAVDLYDDVVVRMTDTGEVICSVSGDASVPVDGSNIAVLALHMVREALSIAQGFDLRITKRIPVGGGLGGGSSDAASALIGARRALRRPEFTDELLEDIAGRLGSDVPFFLRDGIAVGRGRGNDLEPLRIVLPWTFLLVNPGQHVSTSWAYGMLDRCDRTRPMHDMGQLVRDSIANPSRMRDSLRNDFEPVVFRRYPQLGEMKDRLLATGATFALLSGTGGTLYGVYEDDQSAVAAQRQFSSMWSSIAHPIAHPMATGSR